jgi:pimeloyl-ACP methyl ester carboxylesterase
MRYSWNLTSTNLTDLVQLKLHPVPVLPIIFVPGIMGSNLKSKPNGRDRGKSVWLLNDSTGVGKPIGMVPKMLFKNAGDRQTALNPDTTAVDNEGAIPSHPVGSIRSQAEYMARGWGEVGETSYHSFLVWLEETLNSNTKSYNRKLEEALKAAFDSNGHALGATKPFEPCQVSDIHQALRWYYPVYGCGYNWLQDNAVSTQTLKDRINGVIQRHSQGFAHCEQVLLVTHSMGGLVARACAQLPGMADKIAGIVHGVMPATGAPVAYRRCKVGMLDEDWKAGMVIGNNGQDVTAVFAQSPGALELLPSGQYSNHWLRVKDPSGNDMLPPIADPYAGIYGVKDKWWGLIKEEWLAPKGGTNLQWSGVLDNLDRAKLFHASVANSYHTSTYGFHGADPKQASFEHVEWRMRLGQLPTDGSHPPSPQAVMQMSPQAARIEGSNPEYVGGRGKRSHYELHVAKQDGGGDGTVPTSSGRMPAGAANVKQWFALQGFEHEPAYKDNSARVATLYAIVKLAAQVREPKRASA